MASSSFDKLTDWLASRPLSHRFALAFAFWLLSRFVLSLLPSLIFFALMAYVFQKKKQPKKATGLSWLSDKLAPFVSSQSRRWMEKQWGKCKSASPTGFSAIKDSFETLEGVQEALRKAGLESSNLIVGVDFTRSNEWTGKRTFDGRCLHDTSGGVATPYEQAIDVLGRTLEAFDEDHLIPAYGFGDSRTSDTALFSFLPGDRPCHTFAEVLARYRELSTSVTLSGPTSFAPIINRAIEITRETGQFHVVVIIADGQVTESNKEETIEAIVEASNYPLSIILVGVGDGPWDMMEEFDDELPSRRFDNFQFVPFAKVKSMPSSSPDALFAMHALMELPQQYEFISRQRLARQAASRSFSKHVRVLG
eukprot:PLAT14317.1.p1 GENE.PLAT14317.1~~PLAT14317.1.p1  ORF type:complete len:402 (+),score=155.87 PLAT14317.1:113-1207(+)